MCLIAFAWRAHPAWPLIVAANRDEFFARPTASADWSHDGRRLSGRDLRAGGTWMGVTRDGVFAALTNFRDPSSTRADAPSRGVLVDHVLDAAHPGACLEAIARERSRYNGFNLLAVWPDPVDPSAGSNAAIVSHPGPDGVQPVAPEVHGLSNAFLDTPWPKVDAAVAGLRSVLAARSLDGDTLIERLFALLADRSIAADDALPETGVARDVERALSAAFIRMPGYGTRSSTVFVVDASGRATFVERRFEPDAPPDERRFAFALDRSRSATSTRAS